MRNTNFHTKGWHGAFYRANYDLRSISTEMPENIYQWFKPVLERQRNRINPAKALFENYCIRVTDNHLCEKPLKFVPKDKTKNKHHDDRWAFTNYVILLTKPHPANIY